MPVVGRCGVSRSVEYVASAVSRQARHRQPLYLSRIACRVDGLSLTSLHQQPFKLISHAND